MSRVLKRDGTLSVGVPDSRKYIEAYINKTNFRELSTWYQLTAVDTGSFIDQVNYIAHMGGEHKYMYNQENLVNTIAKCGVRDVPLQNFDKEIDPIERHNGSIYAIAYN